MEMIEKSELYPILFEPIYMERMWGGTKMEPVLKRQLPPHNGPIGESWELVDREGEQSVVANGPLAGCPINELIKTYGKDIIGDRFHGDKFPLMVKIIDAGKRLSLQVHPDESACAVIGEGAEPKTEMWYIIDADKNSKIIAGIKANSTKCQIIDTMNSPEVENYLQVFDSKPGDAYFIQSGKIHAIGAGNLLLEIQQNSDTTYRVSDWGRVDANGKSRELHVDKAVKSIHFTDRTPCRISGVSDSTGHNRKFPIIKHCPFFHVDDLRLTGMWCDSTFETRSFHLITAIDHPVTVGNESKKTRVPAGSTCFIPANFGGYTITLDTDEATTVIRTTL
jgi:mannose-6-phosphate isomerase